MVIYKWGKQAWMKYKSQGGDGSNGRNRRREAQMYIVLYIIYDTFSARRGPSLLACGLRSYYSTRGGPI